MDLTREIQVAQINQHLGLPPEPQLSDAAIARLRGPQFLGLWGKSFPDLDRDDPEPMLMNALHEADQHNSVESFPEVWKRSPNHSGSDQFNPMGVIFHFSGYSLGSAINWLTQVKARASYHVIIDMDGSRTRFVDDRDRAWHAGGRNGSSKINGVNPNGVCLGVAFTGNMYDGTARNGQLALTEAEIESAMDFLAQRWERMGLDMDWVSDHRTVDPTRRNDIPPEQLERLLARMREFFG